MKIEGVCAHCGCRVSASITLPATFDDVEGALMAAHEKVNQKCFDGWVIDGLMGAKVEMGAEDRPTSVFHICRHGDRCECFIRCDVAGCGWLRPQSGSCPNPNHTKRSAA